MIEVKKQTLLNREPSMPIPSLTLTFDLKI